MKRYDCLKTIAPHFGEELVVTNTIPLAPEKLTEKITVLSVAPLLADAIQRIHHDTSVSELFER